MARRAVLITGNRIGGVDARVLTSVRRNDSCLAHQAARTLMDQRPTIPPAGVSPPLHASGDLPLNNRPF